MLDVQEWHSRGRGFDSPWLHHRSRTCPTSLLFVSCLLKHRTPQPTTSRAAIRRAASEDGVSGCAGLLIVSWRRLAAKPGLSRRATAAGAQVVNQKTRSAAIQPYRRAIFASPRRSENEPMTLSRALTLRAGFVAAEPHCGRARMRRFDARSGGTALSRRGRDVAVVPCRPSLTRPATNFGLRHCVSRADDCTRVGATRTQMTQNKGVWQ